MSNDQPTERFDAQSGDAPTKRFEAQSGDTPTERFEPAGGGTAGGGTAGGTTPPGSGESPTPFSEPEGKSRTLLIILTIVGGLLLIALVIALTLMAIRGSGDSVPVATSPTPSVSESESPSPEPSESETEEPAPEAEPTTAPPPPAASPSFATFSAPESAMCTSANPTSQLTFSWSSADAVRAWIGVRTTNAKAEPFEEVPTTATYTIDYQCSNDSEVYTVTLEDSAGTLTHKSVTVTKN